MTTANKARAAIITGFAVLAGLAYLADEGHVWAKVIVAVICLPILIWLLAAIGIGAIQTITRRRVRAEAVRIYGDTRVTGIQLLSPVEDDEPVTLHFPEGGDR